MVVVCDDDVGESEARGAHVRAAVSQQVLQGLPEYCTETKPFRRTANLPDRSQTREAKTETETDVVALRPTENEIMACKSQSGRQFLPKDRAQTFGMEIQTETSISRSCPWVHFV